MLICAVLAAPGLARAQTIVVIRADHSSMELTPAALQALPRVPLRATAHDVTTNFEGVELRAVLIAAAAGPVDSLRGRQLTRIIEVVASDGYRVVLPMSDLDRTLGNQRILLADRADGKPLAAADGPWRLVVPGDSRPARSIRMVTRIEVIDIP